MKQTLFRTLVTSAALAMALTSWAGWWSPGYAGGKSTMWDGTQYDYTLTPHGYGGGGRSAAGAVKVSLLWVPAFAGDLPPETIYVEIKSKAWAVSMTGVPDPEPSVENGLGADEKLTLTPIAPGVFQTRLDEDSTDYWQLSTSGMSYIEFTVSPQAEGYLGCGVGLSVRVVPVIATISSDRDPSFKKGPDDLPIPNLQGPPWRLSPRFGDTAVTEDCASGFIPRTWNLDLGFQTLTFGEWFAPWTTWFYPQNAFGSTAHLPLEFTDQQVENLPTTRTVRAVVRDGLYPDREVTVEYRMRIHNQYENWVVCPLS